MNPSSTPAGSPQSVGGVAFSSNLTGLQQSTTTDKGRQSVVPPTPGFSFGVPKPTTSSLAPASGFTSTTTSTVTPGFYMAGPTTSGFSFGTSGTASEFAASSTTSTPTFSNSSSSTFVTATTTTGFTLGAVAPIVSSSATSSSGSGLNLTTPSSGLSLSASSVTTATLAPTFSAGSSLGTATTSIATTSSSDTTGLTALKNSVNFSQLDDTIHKWTLELVELERVFLNQMDQVRDWDRLLLSTGDKIVALNDGMQKVKLRQQQLDHELDFIVAQQRELVECLQPLEKEFADVTVSDPERNSIYQRAENLNTQLQQISEDLKGVIEHINERNKSQDTSDPIVQIGRILNAHMNSLQWVDQNTAVIQHMLDQVGKMRDIHRREADSTQNL